MAIHNHSRWNTSSNKRTTSMFSLIVRGTCISLTFSFICAVLLAVFTLVSEVDFINDYLNYIMVAVSMSSIFVGSVLATQKAEAKGFVIGISIGVLYVCISVLIGMEINNESATLLIIGNKLLAGISAGALGGLVGVNL